MTRAELLALAKRVETEEPSRKLQIAVLHAFGWRAEWNSGFASQYDIWLSPAGGRVPAVRLPDPLHSLDAAVALVNTVRCRWSIRTGDRCNAEVYDHEALFPQARFKVTGNAAHPAAALTAAALRAFAQEAGDDQ